MRQTVTPYLLYKDAAEAAEFLSNAFGFHEVQRMTGGAGGLHVEMQTGDGGGRIYLGSAGDDFRGPGVVGRTSLVYVLVEDVDAHYERAKAAGATIVEELTEAAGDRRYGCRDPEGHEWSFATPIGGR